MQTEKEREKLLSALLDAINKSKHFGNIPLPAALDNPLDELNKKYGYTKLEEKYIPKFEEDKKIEDKPDLEQEPKNENKLSREELSKKLREKIKNYRKRVDKIPPKTIL